tara:strand:- start:319 stop:978 length:660 start_codon:yes stop_codon:yes gene_type:complete
MLIWDIPYYIFPIIALICNVIVVSGNSLNFLRSGNINIKLLWPYLIGSIPFAFVGGSISLGKASFEMVLFFVLFLAGIFLLLESRSYEKKNNNFNSINKYLSFSIGSAIGFVSGVVGIGGGIFLSPLLFLMKAGYPKHITSSASLFILINSIFGILGHLTKKQVSTEIFDFWPFFLVVFFGGQIGSFMNIKIFSNKTLALLTSFLVIFVAVRMGFRVLT